MWRIRLRIRISYLWRKRLDGSSGEKACWLTRFVSCFLMFIVCYGMVWNVMLCYIMLWYVVICYGMLWYVICYNMLCYVMLCYVMLCYVMLWYVMLCHVMICYVMLCYVMSCCNMSCLMIWHNITVEPKRKTICKKLKRKKIRHKISHRMYNTNNVSTYESKYVPFSTTFFNIPSE